ncbi:galectin 17 [Hoplias malabaricus]|uniref:galectin 17 n=1 Tax=Hoplias malabaricus TaxID=27720 RepID=UPI003462A6BC
METISISSRVCVYIFTWLWLDFCVDCSPLSSVHTWSGVGLQAVLPCSCKPHATSYSPYIQWETVTHTVFERMGEQIFQGQDFQSRVDVPKEMLEKGNCSLIFTDIQFGDAGTYESYLVVGESEIKKRIFLQRVQLLVFDHKLQRSVERGEDLVLDLYTRHAATLVFASSEASGWEVLWQRGRKHINMSRLEENKGQLVIQGVGTSDSGTYRVLDADGLALSTVKVSVTDPVPKQDTETLEKQISLNSGMVKTPDLRVAVLTLISSFIIYLI